MNDVAAVALSSPLRISASTRPVVERAASSICGALLIEPERAAILGRGKTQFPDLDRDPCNLGAESVVKLGDGALGPCRIAKDVLAQVLDRFHRLHDIARHVAQRIDPVGDLRFEPLVAGPRREFHDCGIERLDPAFIALVDIELEGGSAFSDRRNDVVGREDLVPVQVQAMQDQLDRVLVEMKHLLAQRDLKRLREFVDRLVQVTRAADVGYGFDDAVLEEGDEPFQQRQHECDAQHVEDRVKDGKLHRVVIRLRSRPLR